MNRDYRFDIARVLCMSFIVVFVHLWAYIHPEVTSAIYVHPVFDILTNSCLGLLHLLLVIFWAASILLAKMATQRYGLSTKNVFCESYLFFCLLL